jgi:hypothetical protein
VTGVETATGLVNTLILPRLNVDGIKKDGELVKTTAGLLETTEMFLPTPPAVQFNTASAKTDDPPVTEY